MEPAFLYKLPAGTSVYRAKTIAKEGRWYTLTLEDAYTYGESITEYKLNKDLNLINITSLTFHNDFIDRLNVMFPGHNYAGISDEKLKCLIPLGLIDLDTQKESLNMIGNTLNIHVDNWNNILEFLSKLMLNRHRFSTHVLDTYLVDVLEKIYGSYFDGYISPIRWPTKVHGHLFPRELCIFKYGYVNEIQTHARPSVGGGEEMEKNTIKTSEFKFNKEHFDKIMEDFNNSIKEYKFQPLWNPHNEVAVHTKPRVNVTRKNRRINKPKV